MDFEDTNVQNAPTSMAERFRKMNDNITLRGVETTMKASTSLLSATKNVRPKLRSTTPKELPSAIYRLNNPASVNFANDERNDIVACMSSTSMSTQKNDDVPKRALNNNVINSMDSFSSPHRVISQGSFLSESPADLDLKRNEEAFESIADMIIDHISPNVVDGYTHYSLSREDVSHLEVLVPMSVRLRFVSALRYRANSYEASSFFVKECMRLGLGQDAKENILLGGGVKMSDGTTQCMLEATVSQPPAYMSSDSVPAPSDSNSVNLTVSPTMTSVNLTVPPSMNWMGKTNLTLEHIQVIMAAQDSPGKKDGVVRQNKGVSTDSTQIDDIISLPDDMKWMIYAGLTPEQMQVTLNAMNEMKEDVMSMTKTISSDLEQGEELEQGLGQQARSPLTINSTFLNDQNIQTNIIQVPELAWRDGLHHIFSNGIIHPSLLLSLGAPLIAAGQVMTRLQFNCTGNPSSVLEVRSNFYSLISAVVLWAVLIIVSLASFYIHWGRGIIVSFDIILFVLTNVVMYAFSVYVIANTRYNLREKYKIPVSKWLPKYEDYVLTALLMPFVVAQMGRHTVDYSIISYSFFSATGLAPEMKLGDAEPATYLPPGSPILSIT